MAGQADLLTFVSSFFSIVLQPLWVFWTSGTIISIGLLIWLVREIVKSIRKIY